MSKQHRIFKKNEGGREGASEGGREGGYQGV